MLSLALLVSGNLRSAAQYAFTPAAPQWNPTEILNWSPATDANAPYNRSVVPLATRFTAPTAAANPALNALWNVNPHARPNEARVQVITSFNTIPVGSPSGFRTYRLCAPNMWQYTDDMVFWGSSDRDTKTILTPTAHTIDAAHRNGVRIYGKIFYGWNGSPDDAALQRIRDLLVKSGNTFPVADKLIEAAVYYGFDGWFINQENYQTTATDAQNMRDFIVYFRTKAAAVGASHLKFVWYDAMAENGSRSFQNAYTTSNDGYMKTPGGALVSHEMFLNFWWYGNSTALSSSRTLALSQGVNPYDLYAGIWTENNRKLGVTPDPNGANELDITWSYLFPEGQPHNTSVGIYGGETPFFKGSSPTSVNTQEEIYWSGPNSDPTNTAATTGLPNWNGFAHYIPANSAVTTLPFVTNFNAGQGVRYHINGTESMEGQWTNLSVQDLLPTWRWIVTTTGTKSITPSLDYTEAYYGGSSLKVTGSLAAGVAQEVKLYQTQLTVEANTNLRFIHKTAAASAAKIEIGLAFEDAPTTMVYSTAGLATGIDWTTTNFPLGAYAGRKIVLITARYSSASAISSYTSYLGRLQIGDAATSTPAAPSALTLEGKAPNPDEGLSTQLRLKWTPSAGTVLRYTLYYRRDLSPTTDSERAWIGSTANNYFFAQDVRRYRGENAGYIEVEAIAPDYGVSPAISVPFTFEALPNLDHPVITEYPLTLPLLASTVKTNNINAFDNVPVTTIEPGAADGEWVGLDLGTAKQITAVRFMPRTSNAGRMLNGVFQGSNSATFSSGVVELARVNARPPDSMETTLTVTNTGTFRYVRYLSPNGGYANLAELKFYAAGDPVPTAPPVKVEGRISGTNAVVYWTPPYAGLPTGYNLKRSTTNGGPYTTIASNLTEPTFRDTGLASGATYYYVVSMNNGNGESPDSAQVTLNPPVAQKLTGTIISEGTANGTNVLTNAYDSSLTTYYLASATGGWLGYDLGTPQSITCVRYCPRSNDASNANNANVLMAGRFQAANNADFSDAIDFAMLTSAANYNIRTSIGIVPTSATYRYVRYLSSAIRTPALADIEFYGGTTPPAPTAPTANARDTGATLTWAAVSGVTRYKVKRATFAGGPYQTINSNVTALTFADTGLTAGNTYYYVVSAMNTIGEGSNSAEASSSDQYAKWLSDSGQTANTGFDQDSNGNGIINGVEYMTPDGVKVTAPAGNGALRSVIRQDPNVIPTLWSSPDLTTWSEVPFTESADQTNVPAGFRRIEAPTVLGTDETKKFYRLKFTR